MLADQVISELQKLVDKYGNLDVGYYDHEFGIYNPVETIEKIIQKKF